MQSKFTTSFGFGDFAMLLVYHCDTIDAFLWETWLGKDKRVPDLDGLGCCCWRRSLVTYIPWVILSLALPDVV